VWRTTEMKRGLVHSKGSLHLDGFQHWRRWAPRRLLRREFPPSRSEGGLGQKEEAGLVGLGPLVLQAGCQLHGLVVVVPLVYVVSVVSSTIC